MFNPDFYPTPPEVIEKILSGLDLQNSNVLEPSSGSGNLIDYVKTHFSCQIFACENDEKLKIIAKEKCDFFLKDDFLKLTAEDVSHIDFIIMNPPFSQGVKHIKHAFEIAPSECKIVSLINSDNLGRYNSRRDYELLDIIEKYGEREDLGECFSTSERKTYVDVSKITLNKPISTDGFNFDGFFMDDEHIVNTTEGLMKPNAVRDLVERYTDAIVYFSEFEQVRDKMNNLLKPLGLTPLECNLGRDNKSLSKEGFMVELQKIFWKKVFSKMNMEKYATKGVMEKINQLSQSQQKIPFTMKNIYKLFEIIVGNSKNIYNQAICEAVDNFTKHIHENRYHVEGWKTNSGYMLNEKIIVPYIMEVAWGGKPSVRYGAYRENLEDLNKVLHNMLGEKYDHKNEIQHAFVKSSEPNQVGGRVNYEYYSFGEWVDWGFFKIKGFKKGTLHLKFKDKKHWELLNRAYAEAKGFSLPEKF